MKHFPIESGHAGTAVVLVRRGWGLPGPVTPSRTGVTVTRASSRSAHSRLGATRFIKLGVSIRRLACRLAQRALLAQGFVLVPEQTPAVW